MEQLFAVQYSLSFTGARSFASAPYNFKALDVGLVLLSLGVGSIAGSVLGTRTCYEPVHRLTRIRQAEDGVTDMR